MKNGRFSFQNKSTKPQATNVVYAAWEAVPEHWKQLIIQLRCSCFAFNTAADLHDFSQKQKNKTIYMDDSVHVLKSDDGYSVACTVDGLTSEFGPTAEKLNEQQLKEKFLEGCAQALFSENSWIINWIIRNIPVDERLLYSSPRQFFVHSFPAFIIKPNGMIKKEYTLMCGLDAATMLRGIT